MNRSHKTALVTGAASGIGRSTAFLLAEKGYRVLCSDISEKGAQEVASGLCAQGADAIAVKADNIRVIGRESLRLVTGTDAKNSQGGDIGGKSGVEIVAMNNLETLQPMVLGDKLRQLLLDFAQILQDSRALVQGVPIPLMDQNSQPMFRRIQSIIEELEPRTEGDTEVNNDGPRFMSHHHYIETNRPNPNQEGQNNEG